MSRPNLVLIGFMGTGKTTIGKICARELGYAFRDSDAEIVRRAGKPIPEIFAQEGEAAFRQYEREAIADLASQEGLVIATGGGAVLDPANADTLRACGTVVLLTAAPFVLLRRVGDARTRPLLASSANPRERIMGLLRERRPLYERAAHFQIDTTHVNKTTVAANVLEKFRQTDKKQ
jgi:shikimate kinase